MPEKRKIINDPVYGFITISHPLIFFILEHPYYQRLRRIQQMAMASMVYPGAVHTRLHHSLGAYHLMGNTVAELRSKGIAISAEEEIAVKCAILLHDIGHGPYSHALENRVLEGVHHETMSLAIMQMLNKECGGALDLAIEIFTNQYHQPFLHQLISGQLDMDRMDYLSRDSFFSGVSEGVIGYDRILKMLTVWNGQLMVEEKGIYSVEKFLIARRQMYWQVYLHKTVLAAEKMMVKIIERVRAIYSPNDKELSTLTALDYFLAHPNPTLTEENISRFCSLDDYDIMHAIKHWSKHSDPILSLLCNRLLNRQLFHCRIQASPFSADYLQQKQQELLQQYPINDADLPFVCFTGEATNTLYQLKDERIQVLFKDGTVTDISRIENALIQENLSAPVKKFYICTLP
ncbi:MAG: HD domain-containing protein [Bacteroidetes bacterium]|nr:HD domain-containing protein [Bacteroidota bacterium]